MRNSTGIVLILLALALLFSPVHAFTADSLVISVQPNGDARITFDYSLSWLEQAAVFARIADPATELRNAFANNAGRPVTIESVTDHEAVFDVQGFAGVKQADGMTSYRTPGLSFAAAEKVLKQYWFAPLISADFSPAVSQVTFPDGYSVRFENQISIPSVTHSVSG